MRGERRRNVMVAVEHVLVQLRRHALAWTTTAERVAAAQQRGQHGEGHEVFRRLAGAFKVQRDVAEAVSCGRCYN